MTVFGAALHDEALPKPAPQMEKPTPSDSTPADATAAYEEASHAVRAASAIISDPGARDRDAAPHLARAWQLLASATGRPAPAETGQPPQTADLLPEAHLKRLGQHQRRALDLLLPTVWAEARGGPTRGPWQVNRRVLMRHARVLGALVRTSAPQDARTGYPAGWWIHHGVRWGAIATLTVLALAVLLGAG